MPPKRKKGVLAAKKPAPLHSQPVSPFRSSPRSITQKNVEEPPNNFLQKELTLQILSIAPSGLALSRHNGQPVFLTSGVPGQTVLAQITHEKKDALWGDVLAVLEKSPHEETPFCEYFGLCGGCAWQEIPYSEQLKIKNEHIAEQLAKIGQFSNITILPTLPSPVQQNFRTKMEFAFTPPRPEELSPKAAPLLGLRERGSHLVVPVAHCPIADKRLEKILTLTRSWVAELGLSAYEEKDGSATGFFRFLNVRTSVFTNRLAVELITAPMPSAGKRVAAFGEELLRLPFVASFTHSIKERLDNIAKGEEHVLLLGDTHLREKLGDITFDISPKSFFQTNILAAEIMQQKVLEFAALTGVEEVWDIYSGVGALSLPLALAAKRVTGIELSLAATEDARRSAKINAIGNCHFIAGDIKHVLKKSKELPDLVVLDPPRAGVEADVLQLLLRKKTSRIIYVSCNPATLARDLKILSKNYTLEKVQPLDMFPHTPHVECIALLEYKT